MSTDKYKRLNIAIAWGEYEKLKKIANKQCRSITEVIRDLIRNLSEVD